MEVWEKVERAKILSRLIEEKGYSKRAFAERIGLPLPLFRLCLPAELAEQP